MIRKAFFATAMFAGAALPAEAASDRDIDSMTSYATVMGRAIGCGMNIRSDLDRVAAWMDRTWTGSERSAMVMIFSAGLTENAKAQREGRSPDSCAAVQRIYPTIPMP